MKIYLASYCIITAILFAGCHAESKGHSPAVEALHEHEHGHGHEHEHEHEPDEILFTREQAEAAGLEVETVSPGAFRPVIKASGQIEAAQGDEVMVAATSNGIVSFANTSLAEGTYVRAGEALLSVSAKNLLEGDPVAKAEITYETAQKEYLRTEELFKNKILSAKEYEQARLQFEMARTAYEAHASSATAHGVRIASPISGYVKKQFVGRGEYVSVGQPVLTVSQNKRLRLRADVPESCFKQLHGLRTANFRMAYDKERLHKVEDLNGRLLSFGRISGEQSYIPVTFEFDNTGEVIPGSFAEVYLLSASEEDAITVPIRALAEEQGLHYIYVQLDEEGYKKLEVLTGEDDGERVKILSGVQAGDRVVTKGVYQVKLAATSSIVPEGHTH